MDTTANGDMQAKPIQAANHRVKIDLRNTSVIDAVEIRG